MRTRWHIEPWFIGLLLTLWAGWGISMTIIYNHHHLRTTAIVLISLWGSPIAACLAVFAAAIIFMMVSDMIKEIRKNWPPVKRVTEPITDDLRAITRPWRYDQRCPGCGKKRYPHLDDCPVAKKWP